MTVQSSGIRVGEWDDGMEWNGMVLFWVDFMWLVGNLFVVHLIWENVTPRMFLADPDLYLCFALKTCCEYVIDIYLTWKK